MAASQHHGRALGAWSTTLLLLFVWLLAPRSAQADEERVHLRYRSTGPCPGRDAFVARVGARTPKAHWVNAPEGVRVFEVTVEADPEQAAGWSQAAGTLTIVEPQGDRSTRRVEGDSCDDVLSALALISALAIDPQAKIAGEPTPIPTPGPPETWLPAEPTAPPAPPPTAPTPAPPVVPPAPSAAGQQPLWVPWMPPPYRSTEPPARWRWTAGALPLAASGVGPELSFVLQIYLDLTLEQAKLVAPGFRLGLSFMPTRVIEHEAGTAELIRVAAHPSGCPIRVELFRDVALRPCLGAEVGLLRASGKLAPERDASTLWLALVLPARLSWSPLDWLVFEVQGELGVPLVRQRFYFEPDRTIVTIDPVFGTVGGGVGVRFP